MYALNQRQVCWETFKAKTYNKNEWAHVLEQKEKKKNKWKFVYILNELSWHE